MKAHTHTYTHNNHVETTILIHGMRCITIERLAICIERLPYMSTSSFYLYPSIQLGPYILSAFEKNIIGTYVCSMYSLLYLSYITNFYKYKFWSAWEYFKGRIFAAKIFHGLKLRLSCYRLRCLVIPI